MIFGLIILLTCVTAISQTSDSFRQKYGEPISETYMVRPGILTTIEYTQSRKICSVSIMSRDSNTIDYPILREVIDEIAPSSQRGKLIQSGFFNGVILSNPPEVIASANENYEHVTISTGGNGGQKQTTTIRWKEVPCEK